MAPPVPQAELVSLVTQLVPLQQPVAHDAAVQPHLPAVQACPLPQATQATPPVPQLPVPEVWHLPLLSQQPLGHDAASHTHFPCDEQLCCAAQAVQTVPLAPQAEGEAVVHEPFEQQPLQLAPPQLQAPELQA